MYLSITHALQSFIYLSKRYNEPPIVKEIKARYFMLTKVTGMVVSVENRNKMKAEEDIKQKLKKVRELYNSSDLSLAIQLCCNICNIKSLCPKP